MPRGRCWRVSYQFSCRRERHDRTAATHRERLHGDPAGTPARPERPHLQAAGRQQDAPLYVGLTRGTEAEKEGELMGRFHKAFTVLFLGSDTPVDQGHEFEAVLTGAAMSEAHKTYSMQELLLSLCWRFMFLFSDLTASSTVRPLARDPRVLIGWPFPLCFWSGRALATGTRRGRVYV